MARPHGAMDTGCASSISSVRSSRRFTAGAVWEDTRLGVQYLRLFERCAIVERGPIAGFQAPLLNSGNFNSLFFFQIARQ